MVWMLIILIYVNMLHRLYMFWQTKMLHSIYKSLNCFFCSLITLALPLRTHFFSDILCMIPTGLVLDHQCSSILAMKATLSCFITIRLVFIIINKFFYVLF